MVRNSSKKRDLPPGFNEDDFMDLEDYLKHEESNGINDSVGEAEPVMMIEDIQMIDWDYFHLRRVEAKNGSLPNGMQKLWKKDSEEFEIDLSKLNNVLKIVPKKLLKKNTKKKGKDSYSFSLPTTATLVYDQDTGDYFQVSVCRACCEALCKNQFLNLIGDERELNKAINLNYLLNYPKQWSKAISDSLSTLTNGSLRWYETGDFISLSTVKFGLEIASRNKKINHYAYTKSIKKDEVDLNEFPENFIVKFVKSTGEI
jgi:hypothetical protein